MSTQPDPNSPVVSDVAALITDVITLLGVAGVAVPAFLQQPSVIVQVAGAVVAVASVVVSHFQLRTVKSQLGTANAKLSLRKGP